MNLKFYNQFINFLIFFAVPPLASGLHHPHHHQNGSKSNSNVEEEHTSMPGPISPHTDFMVKCPQCPTRLGFQVTSVVYQKLLLKKCKKSIETREKFRNRKTKYAYT